MVKQKLKKLLALALSILLLGSNFTELIPHAQAAEPEATATTTDTGVKDQFRDDANGRPNLFVNFLGDNNLFRADSASESDKPSALGQLIAPGGYDKSSGTNQTGPGNRWNKYVNGHITAATQDTTTIFWVGVGIDRKEVFKLLEDNQGLTSFEGGFYYDSTVIEPYYDPAYVPAGYENDPDAIRAAYLRTITEANIETYNNYPANTQWSDQYTVLRAETGLEPTTDPITQEELGEPATLDDIMDKDSTWKMTYVSIELKDIATPANLRRLHGVYKGQQKDDDGNLVTPAHASGNGSHTDSLAPNDKNSDYQYLLLIPFRLKQYGGENKLHLRLLRNATHFSIGAGTYGVDPYGAWERVTTRNPGKDLKLLTRFVGDLYLFGADPTAKEVEYDALLKIVNAGGAENTAKLSVDGDPAVWPVWADSDGDHIYGLQSGIGMKLEVHAQIGYTPTVDVSYEVPGPEGAPNQVIHHSFTTSHLNDQDSEYTFVMPQFAPPGTVTVTVTFTHTDRDNYFIYLSDIPQPENTFYRDSGGNLLEYKTGNETTITTNLDKIGDTVNVVTKYYCPDCGAELPAADIGLGSVIQNACQNQVPDPGAGAGATKACGAVNKTAATNVINTFDPVVTHPNTSHSGVTHADGPRGECGKDKYVNIHVDTHADYEAVVRIYNFLQGTFDLKRVAELVINADISSTVGDKITLPAGGDITFRMDATDIDVEVTYQKAARHKATLEVYHAGATTPVLDSNVAQLAYLAYDDGNIPSMVYSGVVYEDDKNNTTPDRNRTLEASPSRRLEWVSASAATLSGSLGGDTDRSGKVWNPNDPSINLDPNTGGGTVMSLLASAPDLATFQSQINGLDLSRTPITASLTGFRKDNYGALYSDADIATFAAYLWELRQRIEHDGALTSLYKKQVQKSATDTTVAYEYYDLTAAQVQDYLLSIFDREDVNNANQSGYRNIRRAYLTAKRLYDELKPQAAYKDLKSPIVPEEPRVGSVSNSTYVRTYEDPNYKQFYLHNYNLYIQHYQAYLEKAAQDGAVPAEGTELTQYKNNVDPALHTLKPESVPLNTAADAASAVQTKATAATSAGGWNKPIIKEDATASEEDDPKEPGYNIYTRENRTVWVVLEADSAYTVQSVELYAQDKDGNVSLNPMTTVTPAKATVTPAKATGYQNVFSFTMPSEDCVVRVTYALRETRKLNITYTGADGQKDNNATVVAYRTALNPRDTKPVRESRDNTAHLGVSPYKPDPIEEVFVDSVVTITVSVDKEYDVELRVVNHDNATNITYTGPADNRDGTYTFVVPAIAGDIDLTIAYTPKEQRKNEAIINAVIPAGLPNDVRNTAFWRDGGLYPVLTDVPEGTALTGEITVAPGFYIRSVTAYGASGNYTYILTGNGYNGGYGTSVTGTSVPINVFVTMPDETLIVDVEFGYGIPPAAPENTLTLTVKDEDNEGPDFAPNWARATVYDERPDDLDNLPAPEQSLPTVGDLPGDAVGKNASYGNGTLSDRKYVDTGKWVKVDFSNHIVYKADNSIDYEKSYYVSRVSVSPTNLGVSLVWEDDHTVSFYMPAGSAGVTVEFSKYPEDGILDTYFLTVQETYRDLNATPTTITQTDYDDNRVITADSDTIQSWQHAKYQLFTYNMVTQTGNPERIPPESTTLGDGTGVARAGEKVTMTFTADTANWYVQSVVIISDGAAYRGSFHEIASNGTKKTYEAEFRMPTGNAEFIVNYRQGPKPDTPDYAFTLSLTDDDNVPEDGAPYDDNNIVASFTDGGGDNAAHHTPVVVVGHTKGAMTDVRHVHAGDTITLTTTLQPGYTLDYMLVNPSRLKIYPVWTSSVVDADGVRTMTATFTMPTEGVAVVARIIKGDPQQYTANLILHPPREMTSMDGVGKGTFALPTGGTLDNYPASAIFSTYAIPGTTIPYDLYAFDGYYIDRITVDPDLGVTGTLSGAFGYQDGEFTMPAANVNVNVWFEKGWPDEVQYRLTLEVFDASYKTPTATEPYDNNYARFDQISRTDYGGNATLSTADKAEVYGGGYKHLRTLEGVAYDRDTVYVAIHRNATSHVDSKSITITDSIGNPISWWYAPAPDTGEMAIAFTMPPRSTTVRVTFRQGTSPEREAKLHIITDDTTAADQVTLTAASTAAVGSPATVDNAAITGLIAGDGLTLTATPADGRHISAAYAVRRSDGVMIPLTTLDSNNDRIRANLVYAGGTGDLAMPEDDVDVYVRFAAGTVDEDDLPLRLIVSGRGPDISGSAVTDVTGSATQSMDVDAPGMDTVFTAVGDKTVTTFKPKAGYAITKLEVYDDDGNPVPYEWISVLQEPDPLTDPGMWLGTAPGTVATHPTWKENQELQITFTMPNKGVTIHVTYDTVPNETFIAQVVVNDEAYSDLPTPSQNNAWLRTATNNVQAKLQTAKPGEWIDLDVSVHPGYRIEYIKVVPQSFGITPGLPLGPYYTQNTGFHMPAGNVTVYVKFVDDGLDERNATLVVTGAPTGDAANYGTISSPRSGTSPHVLVTGIPQTVLARPDMDWVTADYYWNLNGSAYVQKVTVTTNSGVAVPFTQLEDPLTGHGTITFPMVNENVTVRVVYSTEKPIGEEIYLHVIDATTGDEIPIAAGYAYGRLSYPYNISPGDWNTGNINPERRDPTDPDKVWGHTVGAYYAPAGQRVRVTAQTMGNDGNGPIYLESVYVLYEDVGQMIDLPIISGSATNDRSFVVHPGRNDVYVTFTRREVKPNEHAAILMLKAPEDDAGRASIAANDVYDGNTTDQDSLSQANHGHARVVAEEGNRIYIQVAPAEGYVIDSVLVTPLGFPLQTQAVYNYTQIGNTISFDMPHRDIAITVTLKRGTNQIYKATLHYVNDDIPATAPAIQTNNYAQLSWLDNGAAASVQADENVDTAVGNINDEASIREGTTVTLTGHLGGSPNDVNHPDTILSAFVLRNGVLVPLNPPLEGKQAVSGTVTDYDATFTMPAGDVDVFLVVTTDPPQNPWHTAVLVVTDTSPNGNNMGGNKGYLWKNADTANRKPAETGDPKNHKMGYTWMAVEEGDTFAVQPEANAGYAFVPPATLSCNDGAHGGNMYAESTSPYVYRDTMGTCNKAALITFISDEALELTVIIRDPENPSDDSVTNKLLTRQPTAVTPVPDLSLTSENVGGAYQIMTGVTPGEPILLTATPWIDDPNPPDEYEEEKLKITATAQIYYIDGTVADIPLTWNKTAKTYTGSIPMPTNNATIIVTFHGNYTGTLTIWDLCTDKTSQATMTESTGTAPSQVTVNHLGTSASLTQLPTGTQLVANMIKDDNIGSKTTYALLKRNGSTTLMTSDGPNGEGMDLYKHTINRADAEIIMVVRDNASPTYVAAVETVNKPDSADPASIKATPEGAAFDADDFTWTSANATDLITTTFEAPSGYDVKITTNRTGLTLTDGDAALTPDTTLTFPGDNNTHTVTFPMPAANVQVTVRYVKNNYRLTLRIETPAGATHTTCVTTQNASGNNVNLTQTGRFAFVIPDTLVTLTEATPGPGVNLLSASYAATNGVSGLLSVDVPFHMPAADTVITVRYGLEDAPRSYIALVETVDATNNPGNKATNLTNTTNPGATGDSPYWVEGATNDAIRVAYQIEPGYIAKVTARRADTNAPLAVANVASASNGSATVTMPGGTDVIIRVEYVQDDDPTGKVILQLVAHGTQPGNRADVTSPIAGTLTNGGPLDTDGTASNGAHYIVGGNLASPVETIPMSVSTMGDELRVYANWAPNYQVIRMTVAVRRADNTETPEVPITRSTYGSATTGRTLMPYVADNEQAVIRVYYGNIFEATLHIIPHDASGHDVDGNSTLADDSRAPTVTSSGGVTIFTDGDKLIDLSGDGSETIRTKAAPGPGQRLVGVVWESKTYGATSATSADPTDPTVPYTFTMPAENVDFYAVYEPDDPDNRHYIAKVNFADGSEHLGSADNAVTITNSSDPTASHGVYWTAAKKDETITVNVKVADGYKAEIITTYKDDIAPADHTPPYDFYTSRTSFVPNLTLGKDSVFTMPANTDATVTIKYTKGYKLSLEVADTSGMADADHHNYAKVDVGTLGTLEGYTDDAVDVSGNRIPHYTPDPAEKKPVDAKTEISTTVTPVNDGTKTAPYKVFYATPFSGTVRVDNPYAAPPLTNPYKYDMPSADTVESVLFYNEETPLLAKVELRGESDINGNTATPIKDRTTPVPTTATGTVWTTTDGTHIIDLELTVAKGYVAKIKVRRDNENYYKNPNDESKWDWLDAQDFAFTQGVHTWDDTLAAAVYDETLFTTDPGVTEVNLGFQEYQPHPTFPDDIGGVEHFIFTMPDRDADGFSDPTDVTVIVEFVFAGDIPQPYDPDNKKMVHIDLDEGFIYGENRGDFALIDIPTLEKDKELFDTDNYDKPTSGNKADENAQKAVKFSFYLYDAAKDEYTPLVPGTDVLLEPEDEATLKQTTDPYNYYDYKTNKADASDKLNGQTNDEKTYVGSRFKLIPTDPDKVTQKRSAGAEKLYQMLNNNGSLEKYGEDKYRTTLYVIAEDAIGQKSAYTQVWIRPHFTLQVGVVSYAPNHTTTASVYKLMTQNELDEASGYAADKSLTQVKQDTRDFKHYRWNSKTKPYLSNETFFDGAALSHNKYYQMVGVKSSELLGWYDETYDPGKDPLQNVRDDTEAHYALTLEKASHLTYTRVDLDLMPKAEFGFDLTTDPNSVTVTGPSSGYYDKDTLTYTISDDVYLITGDVDGNGMTKWQDYDTVYSYVYRNLPWDNTQTEKPKATDPQSVKDAWEISVYNPDSQAYWCDLNGDRMLTDLDIQLVQTVFDYNRTTDDYLWTRSEDSADGTGHKGDQVLPFGFDGTVKGTVNDGTKEYISLFALDDAPSGTTEPFPVDPDPYWDSLVDPETTTAPPLNNPYVDENDELWADPVVRWDTGPVVEKTSGHKSDSKKDKNADDEILSTPMGDEVLERPAVPIDPGLWVELPDLDPILPNQTEE